MFQMIRSAPFALLFWAGLPTSQAGAQEACFPRDLAVAGLGALSATPVAIGETDDGMGAAAALEVYVDQAGDFTILLSYPDGFSCILARGAGFQIVRGEPS